MNKTSIEWTQNGYTWNPTIGCTHVSAGCQHCYAEALSLRFGRSAHPWIKPYERENVQLRPERLRQPFALKAPAYVFVDSMSDLFHHLVPVEYIAKVFAVMAATPHITYQILTKRPERMCQFVIELLTPPAIEEAADALAGEWGWCHIWGNRSDDFSWPLPNVWLGTSVEDQRVVDRIDWLIQTPAAVRFLSVEPMIGPVDLSHWLAMPEDCPACNATRRWRQPITGGRDAVCDTCGRAGGHDDRVTSPDLHWIIVGGESGPTHRPFDPQWARAIRDQCVAAGVPFFFKQHGGRTPKAGGRLLDGREWNEMPATAAGRGQLALIGAAR